MVEVLERRLDRHPSILFHLDADAHRVVAQQVGQQLRETDKGVLGLGRGRWLDAVTDHVELRALPAELRLPRSELLSLLERPLGRLLEVPGTLARQCTGRFLVGRPLSCPLSGRCRLGRLGRLGGCNLLCNLLGARRSGGGGGGGGLRRRLLLSLNLCHQRRGLRLRLRLLGLPRGLLLGRISLLLGRIGRRTGRVLLGHL